MKNIARKLRRNSTEAEKKIWRLLRSRQIAGCKFRRQFPVGPYIVDFCCWEKRVIIEIDGGQHAEKKESDQERDLYLMRKGFRVRRIWNHEVMQNPEGVVQSLLELLNSPHPSPLPRGEGG